MYFALEAYIHTQAPFLSEQSLLKIKSYLYVSSNTNQTLTETIWLKRVWVLDNLIEISKEVSGRTLQKKD